MSFISDFFGGGGGTPPSPTPYSQMDPYGALGGRQQAAVQLQNLTQNPASAMGSPLYAAMMQSGEGAIAAGDAASGNLGSGAAVQARTNLGQTSLLSSYNALSSQDASLSGANQSPATVGNQMYNQQQSSYSDQQQQTQQSWNNIFGAVGAVTGASLGMPGGGGSMFSGISAMFDSLFGNNYGNLAQQNSSQMGNPNSTVQNYPGV